MMNTRCNYPECKCPFEMGENGLCLKGFAREGDSGMINNFISLQDISGELASLRADRAALQRKVEELEKKGGGSELVHVGYTNGHQIKYAKDSEGSFYPDTENDCWIPLYMLAIHTHRLQYGRAVALNSTKEDV